MGYNFYIDESGNTGTDWLNPTQPYFVYGGWLIDTSDVSNAENYLRSISSTMQSKELKSRNIFKQKNGEEIFYQLFDKMCFSFNALPIFRFIDKKFMISAKIVETFFDPAYNPFVNMKLTAPIELKKSLACCIAESDHILSQFSSLIKNCTLSIDEMKLINNDLIKLFECQGHKNVANTLKDLSDSNLCEMLDEFKSLVENNVNRKNRITLTGTTLVSLLNCAEIISDDTVNVIHDKLRGYDGAFDEIRKMFLRDTTPEIFGTDARWMLSNFPNINSINMEDSKNELLIQSADLLCGFISRTFKTFLNQNTLHTKSINIIKQLIFFHDTFLPYSAKTFDYYSTYEFEPKLIHSINPQKNITPFNYHNFVNNNFENVIKY